MSVTMRLPTFEHEIDAVDGLNVQEVYIDGELHAQRFVEEESPAGLVVTDL